MKSLAGIQRFEMKLWTCELALDKPNLLYNLAGEETNEFSAYDKSPGRITYPHY